MLISYNTFIPAILWTYTCETIVFIFTCGPIPAWATILYYLPCCGTYTCETIVFIFTCGPIPVWTTIQYYLPCWGHLHMKPLYLSSHIVPFLHGLLYITCHTGDIYIWNHCIYFHMWPHTSMGYYTLLPVLLGDIYKMHIWNHYIYCHMWPHSCMGYYTLPAMLGDIYIWNHYIYLHMWPHSCMGYCHIHPLSTAKKVSHKHLLIN